MLKHGSKAAPQPLSTTAHAALRRGVLALALLALSTVALHAAPAPVQYAVIVNGDDSFTHNHNVELALVALGKLGYAPANTYLFTPAARPDGASSEVRLLPATTDAIEHTIKELRRTMTSSDLLLVYLTGHGGKLFGRPMLALEHGAVSAKDLAHEIGTLAFDRLILIADQCYSGSFVNAFTQLNRNVVAVSSVDDSHEVRCEPFVRPLWAASTDPGSRTTGEAFVAIENAYQIGQESLEHSLGEVKAGIHPQYAATGTCRGRHNSFSLPAVAAVAPTTDLAAGRR